MPYRPRHPFHALLLLLAVSIPALNRTSSALADGGRLQKSSIAGSYQISVFTSPTPVRVGEVDVSVMVQESDTGQLIQNASLEIRCRHLESGLSTQSLGPPPQTTGYYESRLNFPNEGLWQVEVSLAGETTPVTFELTASPSPTLASNADLDPAAGCTDWAVRPARVRPARPIETGISYNTRCRVKFLRPTEK